MMEKFSHKAIVVGVGAVMGISASLLAMIPSSRGTEAAIAVFDEKNIEEAIKTAIQTANILTEAQKQYALILLNTKKLDAGTLMELLGQTDLNIQGLDILHGNFDGILKKTQTNGGTVWDEKMGRDYPDAILRGDLTVQDLYNLNKERSSQAMDTVNDATAIVRNMQKTNKEVMENSRKITETSNQAEGELQAQQANTAAVTNETNAIVQGNEALTAIISYEQMKRQDIETQKAYSQAVANMYKQSGDNFLKNYDWSKNIYRE